MEKLSAIHIFIVVYFLLAASQNRLLVHSQFRADYNYYPEARAWFKYHKVPTDWHEARLKCYFEGGNLASPLNDRIYGAMRSMMLMQSGPAFTGVHMMNTAGDYYSIEGISFLDMPIQWAKGEPNNLDKAEYSLAILPDGTFADVKPKDVLPFICYKQKTGNETISSDCGTAVKGYELDPESNSCYKFHSDCVNWHRALMVCYAEGGHLIILNSAREPKLMFDRYSEMPLEIGCRAVFYGHRYYHAGIHNLDVDRAYWFTLDGQRIEDSGYATWLPDEPNDAGARCGTFAAFPEGAGYNDGDCNYELPFICEINNPKTRYNAN